MRALTRKPVHCPCGRLIAFMGIATDGDPYFHVKSHKQGKVLSNVVIYGDCEIQCQGCSRWHIYTFREDGGMDKEESLKPPAEIAQIDVVGDTNTT